MNVELTREWLREFRPCAVVTSTGHRYAVPHTDLILLHPRTIAVVDDREAAVVLNPLRMVALENLPARKNGRTKRR